MDPEEIERKLAELEDLKKIEASEGKVNSVGSENGPDNYPEKIESLDDYSDISEVDKKKFLECIVSDKCFTMDRPFLGGKFIVNYKERSVADTDYIINKVMGMKIEDPIVLESTMNKYYLAFSVNTINSGGEILNLGSVNIDSKLKGIDTLGVNKYMLMLDGMFEFEKYVSRLREMAKSSVFF